MKIALFIFILALSVSCALAQADNDYDQLIVNAGNSLKQGQLDEAQQDVQQAIKLNPTNYLAYAVAAKIASKQGDSDEANSFIKKALEFAPNEDRDKVKELARQIQSAAPTPSTSVGSQTQSMAPTPLSDEDQLKLDSLMLILNDADKAVTPEDQARYFQEFLEKSGSFADAHPGQTNIWVMRAFAAIQLNYPGIGWAVGRRLRDWGMVHNDDPKVRDVMAELERNGWLDDTSPTMDWSSWSPEKIKMAIDAGDKLAQQKIATDQERQKELQERNARFVIEEQRKHLCGTYYTSAHFRADYTQNGSIIISPDSQSPNCVVVTGQFDCSLPKYKGVIEPTIISLENTGPGGHMANVDLPESSDGFIGSTKKGKGWTLQGSFAWKGDSGRGKSKTANLTPYYDGDVLLTFGDVNRGLFMTEWQRH